MPTPLPASQANPTSTNPNTQPLLQLKDCQVGFPTEDDWGHPQMGLAIRGLDFDMQPGEICGLVGESGCGKSMTSYAILRLVPPPGKLIAGSITFDGQALHTLSDEAMRRIRGHQIALIPQDPMTALNPVYTVGDQIIEVLQLHRGLGKADAKKAAIAALEQVRIPNAKERVNAYPHEFSGGMRQRVMIAMALSCQPKLLIADEPTTALDVTVQAQILELMRDIRRDHGTAILLITHDLGVVAELCDRVAVMYAGRVIEEAPTRDLFAQPKHPYTQGLLASLPNLTTHATTQPLTPIPGRPPGIHEQLTGCAFTPRCPKAFAPCQGSYPGKQADGGHQVWCFLS
jgi:oligopeptide/dipeptide ABC transporter ATP-binding protein